MLRNNIVKVTQQAGYKLARREISAMTLQKDIPSNAYTMGACGTTKWEVEDKVKLEQKRAKISLPDHLIRPPCVPGSQTGGFQTCMMGDSEGGMYCIPCKERYKYPPFSENIDFVPPQETTCWWKGGSECRGEVDDSPLGGMTRPCPIDIDL